MVSLRGAQLWVLGALAMAGFCLWTGCALRDPLQTQYVGELGRFELQSPDRELEGVVVGVPHGTGEPDALDFARSIRAGMGAALVIAYDFGSKRIPVAQPLVHTSPIAWPSPDHTRPGSVYPEFKKLLQSAVNGPIKFFVGVRLTGHVTKVPVIEVATGGFAYEQVHALKAAFTEMRDRSIKDTELVKIELSLNPLDDISWNASGVKNHGVLMLAEKGLILRLPRVLAVPRYKAVYGGLLTSWVKKALAIAKNSKGDFPEVDIKRVPFGRIESTPSRNGSRGFVIAAPHGSFDWYTSELVEELSFRTALPAIVTRGFTPTECGGWRINVNRPTERRYPTDVNERKTQRSTEIFQRYRDSVFQAAGGPLDLYIEMHQNGSEAHIDVATLGVTRRQAMEIKDAYRKIRDRVLGEIAEVPRVSLVIEPLDAVAIGARGAKEIGMLKLAESSLHFELPAQHVFYSNPARRAYTRILAELIKHIVTQRNLPQDRAPSIRDRPWRSKSVAE